MYGIIKAWNYFNPYLWKLNTFQLALIGMISHSIGFVTYSVFYFMGCFKVVYLHTWTKE